MTLVLSMIEFQHCLIMQQWVYRTIGRSSRWVVDQFSFDEMRWQQKIWPCCTHDQFENGLNWKKSEFFSSFSSFRSREILLIKSSPGRLRWKSIFWRRQPLIKKSGGNCCFCYVLKNNALAALQILERKIREPQFPPSCRDSNSDHSQHFATLVTALSFFKMGHSRPLFSLFSSFLYKCTIVR